MPRMRFGIDGGSTRDMGIVAEGRVFLLLIGKMGMIVRGGG